MIREKGREGFYEALFWLVAMVSIVCVVIICVFLFARGIPAIAEIGVVDFLLGDTWRPTDENNPLFGILPMIVGSIYITTGAIILGVPVGLLTAVFLTHYCSKRLYKIIKPILNLMAGIPSILYGFFGMVVLVPWIRDIFNAIADATGNGDLYTSGQSILTASILLGIMILPTIINLSESAIRAVPGVYYEGARALGSTHERAVFGTVVPGAKSGIFAAVVLGIGRAVGETMAVVMVAGNQARLTGNILKGIRTMTANVVQEMKYAEGLHQEALIATGVVLFIFILIINLCFSLLNRKAARA